MTNKTLIVLAFAASTLSPAAFANPVSEDYLPVPVAAYELSAGETDIALAKLEAHKGVAANDPSRLLNLAAAYARKGQINRAEAAYRAVLRSDTTHEVELLGGRYIDSREAARLGLARLKQTSASR